MPRITIVLTGDAELNRKLKQLTNAEAKKAIRSSARSALKPVLSAARELAPSKTGRLRRTIKIRSITRSRKRVGARVTTSATDHAYSGKAFYGAFLEFGRKTGSRKSQNRRAVSPLSFLKRAADRTRHTALQLYGEGIRDFIQSVCKG